MAFVVSIEYYRSESHYEFGPFGTEKTLNQFLDRVQKADPDGKLYGEPYVSVINNPMLFGTGNELS